MSQEALADKIGVSFQQVQKYEKGTNRVGASRLTMIANVLQSPITAFFEGVATAGSRGPKLRSPGNLITEPFALRLVEAFSEIEDVNVRRAVVEFVQALGSVRRKHSSVRTD